MPYPINIHQFRAKMMQISKIIIFNFEKIKILKFQNLFKTRSEHVQQHQSPHKNGQQQWHPTHDDSELSKRTTLEDSLPKMFTIPMLVELCKSVCFIISTIVFRIDYDVVKYSGLTCNHSDTLQVCLF